MLVVIRGAGDIATGIAVRLHRAGLRVVMLETGEPTAIRRTVAFSDAVREVRTTVEDIEALRADTAEDALKAADEGVIPVLVDPAGSSIPALKPDAVVDAILAKRNLGTTIDMAPVVVGVGPGFTAGEDCNAVVETQRGHNLGRVYVSGSAAPNTGVPGIIGGIGSERVLRAPADGMFRPLVDIGSHVGKGEMVGEVSGPDGTASLEASISGVLRGILPAGTKVHKGMKSGDIDPRGEPAYCFTVSDKALAVGGGVLEAVMGLTKHASARV